TEALVDVFSARIPDTIFSTVETPGAVAAVDYLESGLGDVSIAQSDVAYIAFTKGTEALPVPHRNLRGMAVLYVSPVHVIVGPDRDIHTLQDIRGKRVGVGPPG